MQPANVFFSELDAMTTMIRQTSEDSKRDGKITAVLNSIAQLSATFFLDHFGQIRTRDRRHPGVPFCPITLLCLQQTGKAVKSRDVHEAAEALGIGDVSTQLVDAIDERRPSITRDRMLRACRLKED